MYTERKLRSLLKEQSERLAKGTKRFPVEDFFKEDDDQKWKDLPMFPGYQFSNNGYVRSIKSGQYGNIISYKNTSNGIVYNLNDANGKIRTVSITEIESMVDFNTGKTYRTFDEINYKKRK